MKKRMISLFLAAVLLLLVLPASQVKAAEPVVLDVGQLNTTIHIYSDGYMLGDAQSGEFHPYIGNYYVLTGTGSHGITFYGGEHHSDSPSNTSFYVTVRDLTLTAPFELVATQYGLALNLNIEGENKITSTTSAAIAMRITPYRPNLNIVGIDGSLYLYGDYTYNYIYKMICPVDSNIPVTEYLTDYEYTKSCDWHDSAALTITGTPIVDPLVVTRQPVSATAYVGKPHSLSFLTEPKAATYTWYRSTDGGATYQTVGENADTLPIDTSEAAQTSLYYCVAENRVSSVTSDVVSVGVELCLHEHFTNGICHVCGSNEPATLTDGIYRIANAGNLMWFAQLVNGGAADADAMLVADIDMAGIAGYVPIGNVPSFKFELTQPPETCYAGTFDGQGHVIRNLTLDENATYQTSGVFGSVRGTVKNLGVENYRYQKKNTSLDGRFGAIAGQVIQGGTITDCYVHNSTVDGDKTVAGIVAGSNYGGTIQNCYTLGCSVQGYSNATQQRYGWIAGDCRNDTGTGTVLEGQVINCYTDGARIASTQAGETTNCQAGVTQDRFQSGEIAWLLNGSEAAETSPWRQTLGADAQPVLSGALVYYGAEPICDGSYGAYSYSNTPHATDIPPHSYENGVCTVCGAEIPSLFDFSGVSVSVGNTLGMYFWISETNVADGDYAVVVKNYTDRDPVTVTVPKAQWLKSGSFWLVPFTGIAAKEMMDEVTCTVYSAEDTQKSNSGTSSVRKYADNQLKLNIADGLRTLLVDMLNYGAAAQEQFAYDTANPANKELGDDAAFATATIDMEALGHHAVKGEGMYGGTLTLKSSILMNVFFETSKVTRDMTAKISYTNYNNKAVSYEITGDQFQAFGTAYLVVNIETLVAADLATVVNVDIYDGETQISHCEYNMAQYCQSTATAPISVALAKYCTSARNYFV